MRSGKDKVLLRFLVSAIGGTAVALGMLIVGIAISGAFEDDPTPLPELEEVELISTVDRVDVAELLAEREAERIRNAEPPPPPELPPRLISGFVQLEYEVDETGRVTDVRVLAAVPRGIYEEQAVAEIQRQLFTPTFEDGVAVASVRSDVVEFSVELPRQPTVTGEGESEAGTDSGSDPDN
jgi:TonB family protein